MDLEDVLCQIKTDCCNIAHGWLPLLVIFDDYHFGTSMPSGGHSPHQLAASVLSTTASPDSRCFASPVKYGRFFDIAGACPGRHIFGGVP
jgi:hypothetical protein